MRNSLVRVRLGHRPRLETLETRLPPGDAVLGLLLAWPEVPPETREMEQELVSAFDFAECETPALVISRARAHAGDHPATAISSVSTDDSTDLRAAGLIPAVYTAGINPAARPSAVSSAKTSSTMPFAVTNLTRPERGAAAGSADVSSLARRVSIHNNPTGERGGAATAQPSRTENFGNLPLVFEANHGQTDARVDFIARTGDATVFLTPTAAVFALQDSEASGRAGRVNALDTASLQGVDTPRSPGVALYMNVVGGNPNATPITQDPQSGIVNYFIGNDPSQWHSDIPTFGRVEYQDVYPGIDLAYYGNQSPDREGAGLEYDFIVSPGADPNAITLNFAGADGLEIDRAGNLVVHTAAGHVVQQKPYLYQEVNGARQEVAGNFVLSTEYPSHVAFDVGAYDASRPLVIDPLVMGYSTYLGGSDDEYGNAIAVDRTGAAYVTGQTASPNFPTTPGAFDTTYNYVAPFVSKLNATGSGLDYSTYLGEFGTGYGIAVDSTGNAYVTGYTGANFPTTPGGFDTTHNGGHDAFAAKLNATGSALLYGTYLGGSDYEQGYGIALDRVGNAYVMGETWSTNFPATVGAFDTTHNGLNDAFVAKLNATGSALAYGTYVGGNNFDYAEGKIAVDKAGSAYIAGDTRSFDFPTTPGAHQTTKGQADDVFVTKLTPAGDALAYSTYLGGGSGDLGFGIAVDAAGSAYVTGTTGSGSFPITNVLGSGSAFLTKMHPSGSGLVYSAKIGGDLAQAVALDAAGNAYVSGSTKWSNITTTPDAFDASANGGYDAFLVKVNAGGNAIVYGTYLGGSGTEFDYGSAGVAVDASGNAYLTGVTDSPDFPTTPGAFKQRNRNGVGDAFVTKFVEV